MKIQIFGYGFVGKAHALALEDEVNKTYVYDPALGYDELIENPDCAIICVSTPQSFDGSCFMGNVLDAISKTPDIPILIKSTISLEGWNLIKEEYPTKQITFSPEFLRAAYAMEDFKNQKEVYVGGGNFQFWKHILRDFNCIWAKPEELILAKYVRNSFLALKVAFFNQVYDLCKQTGTSFDDVQSLVTKDKRIGDSHTLITDERGFGGHCFPKDTKALLKTAEEYGYNLSILLEAVEYNDKLRNEND